MTGFRARALERRSTPGKADKLRRALWHSVWITLYRPSPTPLFSWRRFLLRCFGAEISGRAHPYPSAKVWAPSNLTMRKDSCLASGVNCFNVAKVVIGERAIVSQGAYLCTATHDYNSRTFDLITGEITIEEDCWIASEAFVGPGVTLSRGCVALARAAVVRDIPAWTVVGGNPAKDLGERT